MRMIISIQTRFDLYCNPEYFWQVIVVFRFRHQVAWSQLILQWTQKWARDPLHPSNRLLHIYCRLFLFKLNRCLSSFQFDMKWLLTITTNLYVQNVHNINISISWFNIIALTKLALPFDGTNRPSKHKINLYSHWILCFFFPFGNDFAHLTYFLSICGI